MSILVLPATIFIMPIVISLWCMGLTVVSKEGMILHNARLKINKWASSRRDFVVSHLEARLQTVRAEKIEQGNLDEIVRLQTQIQEEMKRLTWKDYVAKPLILCPVCMASLHGLVISLMFVVFESSDGGLRTATDVFIILWGIVAAAFLNFVINKHLVNVG